MQSRNTTVKNSPPSNETHGTHGETATSVLRRSVTAMSHAKSGKQDQHGSSPSSKANTKPLKERIEGHQSSLLQQKPARLSRPTFKVSFLTEVATADPTCPQVDVPSKSTPRNSGRTWASNWKRWKALHSPIHKLGVKAHWPNTLWKQRASASSSEKMKILSSHKRSKPVVLGDYNLLENLGTGSFGQVFLAQKRGTSSTDLVAIKVLNKTRTICSGQLRHTLTERAVMRECGGNPFLLSLQEAFQTEHDLCLVSEFCCGGELYFHLEQQGKFNETVARFVAAEITDAIAYLHEKGVAYRDLKSENILLDIKGHVKIADFGLARLATQEYSGATTLCGSLSYLAPEIITCYTGNARGVKQSSYGQAVDWWSLGVLLYSMVVGNVPFQVDSVEEYRKTITCCRSIPFPISGVSPICQSLIKGLMTKEPGARLGCKDAGGVLQLRSHSFFAPTKWYNLRAKRTRSPLLDFIKPGSGIANFDSVFTSIPVEKALLLHRGACNSSAQEHSNPQDQGDKLHTVRFSEKRPSLMEPEPQALSPAKINSCFTAWDVTL